MRRSAIEATPMGAHGGLVRAVRAPWGPMGLNLLVSLIYRVFTALNPGHDGPGIVFRTWRELVYSHPLYCSGSPLPFVIVVGLPGSLVAACSAARGRAHSSVFDH